jgi:hypothetical protein
MEIVLSDQGSTDGSAMILRDLVSEYDGPNTVRLLECQDTEFKGMPGMNAHLDFIHRQIDADYVIMCSADDLNHPDRAAHVVAAFEQHGVSYVGTGVTYEGVEGVSRTEFPDRRSRRIEPAELIRYQIGSCASSAWRWDLFEKYGPFHCAQHQDVLLPIYALLERGYYFVDELLHTYVMRPSIENTGAMGQMAAATDLDHKHQLVEVNNFFVASSYCAVLRRLMQTGEIKKLPGDAIAALYEKLLQASAAWSVSREKLTMARISPIAVMV